MWAAIPFGGSPGKRANLDCSMLVSSFVPLSNVRFPSHLANASYAVITCLAATLLSSGMMEGQTGGCALSVIAGPPTLDTGDGGPALEAQFNGLQQIAFDSAGNLYVADTLNSKIRRIASDGIVSTIAGHGEPGFCGDGGPARDACLKTPQGVAVDGEGNLFIADSGNYRIRKVSPSGVIETVAGTGDAGFNQAEGLAIETNLGYPTSLAAHSDGTLFILDRGNFDQLIYRLDRSGQIKTIAGYFRESGEAPQRPLSLPGPGTDLSGSVQLPLAQMETSTSQTN